MTESEPVAGWYPDQREPLMLRYWDGAGWTKSCRRSRAQSKADRLQKKQAAQKAKDDRAAARTPTSGSAPTGDQTRASEVKAEASRASKWAREQAEAERAALAKSEASRIAAALAVEKAKKVAEKAAKTAEARTAATDATRARREASEKRRRQEAAAKKTEAEAAAAATGAIFKKTKFYGSDASTKELAVIEAHCLPGESPWLAVRGSAGILAVWEDRLMIVKTGLLTSYMAGVLGGARITTFPFLEITGIEYNAQMLSGVLEVLTASYQGTANKDYWRGTTQSRNADSNDPWTLSNTLPLAKSEYNKALPDLNRMRQMIIAAKAPYRGEAQQSSQTSIADELLKLSALREGGILTEVEFDEAKAGLLGKFIPRTGP